MDPTSFDFEEIQQTAQPRLTPSEMALRDKFVIEYIKDYNQYAACIRIGYSPVFAKEFSTRFMNETYVLNQIQKQEIAPVSADEDFDETTQKRKVYAALWKEANSFGLGSSQSARVAALAKLSSFLGMDAPTRSQQELTGKDGQPLGGGVIVVPGLMTAEQWAEQAEAQQDALLRAEPAPPQLKVVG